MGKILRHLSSALLVKCATTYRTFFLFFFSCVVGSDQTTGKSNEAARARMFLQVVANPGHLSISVAGSRGSVQSKALALSVQGVGLIKREPAFERVTFGTRGTWKDFTGDWGGLTRGLMQVYQPARPGHDNHPERK